MNISRVIFAALVSVAIAGAGFAADTKEKSTTPSTTTTTKAPSASNEHRFRGSVSALDAKAGTLKVKGKSEEKTFTVGDKAKSSFAKVKVGDSVRVTYADEGGKLMVHSFGDSKNSQAKSNK